MPAVLVTRPTVIQNSPFSSPARAVTIDSRPTHSAYPRRDDQAELTWVTVTWWNTKTPMNGHPSQ